MLAKLSMPLWPLPSGPHPSLNTVTGLTQMPGSSCSSPSCVTINTNPLQSGYTGNNLAKANLRVVLLDVGKTVNATVATALRTTSQPQYSHRTDSDAWLKLLQSILCQYQHKPS